ncbi:MAG: GNAT family N-acetyltransferase [Leptolyngbya sp. SIO1D8]|nr:GNAT family N-acetyltransferase [Leptolyngbya sp. SIO1D8]
MSSPIHTVSAIFYVRSATEKDLQQLSEVLTSSFYPPLGWRRWVYPVLRFGIYEDLKQRVQAKQHHYRCLAAIAPHSANQPHPVIGTLEISCRRYGLWAFKQTEQLYISNLAVREDCRRQGVARKLLTVAEQQALNWGFREMYLHVMANNHRARQLYQHMGYQIQQVEPTLLSLVSVQPQRLLLKKVLSTASPASPIFSPSPEIMPR